MSHAGHVTEERLFNASKQRSSLEFNFWNQKMEKRVSEGQEVNLQRAVWLMGGGPGQTLDHQVKRRTMIA